MQSRLYRGFPGPITLPRLASPISVDPLRNVRILVAYDGSAFYGWQRQAGFESVQEALEDALFALTGDRITVRGSGRTDTGVHAFGQVANFHVDTRLDDNRLWHALNAHLPEGASIRRLETCRDDFHAQYDACGKRYVYLIRTHRYPLPFGRGFTHFVRDPLHLAAMREAAALLVGTHDFRAFSNTGSPRKSSVRRITSIRLIPRRESLAIVVSGTGFLYRMVRVIAGTLLKVGRDKMSAEDVRAVLLSKDRNLAGATAPAQGLYLLSVRYDEPLFRNQADDPSGLPGVFPLS
ncbi:MAG: tRNA pseudouridine38-40 synthase [Planctomycetota bacterium]|jgi:tRNA pseudouridine38-40 synthase